jgi:lipid A 3-O-deacylase
MSPITKSGLILLAIGLLLALFGFVARADVATVEFENDFITETDKYYTHGTRLMWQSDSNLPWAAALDYFDTFDGDTKRSALALSQYIYTPSTKEPSWYLPGDRPYCGWLYLSFIATATSKRSMSLFSLDLGIVGPDSYAEETQIQIHKWIGSQLPMGWHHQIKDEPGADLAFQQKYRLFRADTRVIDFDLIPHGGGVVGNVHDYVDAGCLFRVGYNLPEDFGLLRMEPAIRALQGPNARAYLFVDTEGKYVVRNLTLDGNTFRDSHSVPKEDWVGELTGGACVQLYDVDVVYAYTYRTREFEGQDEPEVFGSFSLSYTF